jgi:uncharacterized protein (TIGR03437 family)
MGSRLDGPAAAIHVDGSLVTPAAPARRGETLQMFGTGLGIVNPLLMMPIALPVVRVGGRNAEVKYGGRAPGWPGMTQINFVVPADAPSGAAVPVEFVLIGNPSNAATLAVSF